MQRYHRAFSITQIFSRLGILNLLGVLTHTDSEIPQRSLVLVSMALQLSFRNLAAGFRCRGGLTHRPIVSVRPVSSSMSDNSASDKLREMSCQGACSRSVLSCFGAFSLHVTPTCSLSVPFLSCPSSLSSALLDLERCRGVNSCCACRDEKAAALNSGLQGSAQFACWQPATAVHCCPRLTLGKSFFLQGNPQAEL